MSKLLKIVGILAAVYVSSYIVFRTSHIETWEKDGERYLIFPKESTWVYYLYRPLTYLDSKVTKMHFHIGPHQ